MAFEVSGLEVKGIEIIGSDKLAPWDIASFNLGVDFLDQFFPGNLLITGGNVEAVNDLAGGDPFEQTSATNRPTWSAGVGATFTNSSPVRWLDRATDLITDTTGTTFIVVRLNSTATQNFLSVGDNGVADGNGFNQLCEATTLLMRTFVNAGAGGGKRNNVSVGTGAFKVLVYQPNNFYINQELQTTSFPTTGGTRWFSGAVSPNGMRIGRQASSQASSLRYSDCTMKGAFNCSAVLNNRDIIKVVNFLREAYSI